MLLIIFLVWRIILTWFHAECDLVPVSIALLGLLLILIGLLDHWHVGVGPSQWYPITI